MNPWTVSQGMRLPRVVAGGKGSCSIGGLLARIADWGKKHGLPRLVFLGRRDIGWEAKWQDVRSRVLHQMAARTRGRR